MDRSAAIPRLTRPEWQATALFAACVVSLLLCSAASLLNDPDTQWHIAAGRLMWTTGVVPEHDVFSHTFAGAPWIAKEWLSQLILFAAYSNGGWRGVSMVAALAIAAALSLTFGWMIRRIRWTAALAIMLIVLPLMAPEWLARPHSLVLPLMVLWVMELAMARERGSAPRWWAPALMTAWANMHASYPVGLILGGLFAAEAIVSAPAPVRKTCLVRWLVFLALSTAAVCISPYGYKTILVVLTVSQTQEATNIISEWQPIGFGGQGVFAALAVGLSLLAVLRRPRENVFRAAAILLLGYMMVRHGRFALLFGMLTPLLIAGPIARAFRQLSPTPFRVRYPWTSGVVGLVALTALVSTNPTPSPSVAPTAALRFAAAEGLAGPVYNDYDFGGFLILNGVKTFIDGRNDQLFNGGFTNRLTAALANRDGNDFLALLDRAHVAWAIVKPGSKDAQFLQRAEEWSALFNDYQAAIFAKRRGLPNGAPS